MSNEHAAIQLSCSSCADLSDERHQVIGDDGVDLSISTSLHVSEISHMSHIVAGRSMRLAEGVEMWPSGGAAISQIAELSNSKRRQQWVLA
jgi:hypothetical protein